MTENRWVSQTKFGGEDASQAEMGDCLQACIASIIGISLGDAFDANAYSTNTSRRDWQSEEHWYVAFERWAAERGLSLFWLQQPLDGVIGIADVHSKTLGHGVRHAVVARGADVIWDPNPHSRGHGHEYAFFEQSPCFMYLVPSDLTQWAHNQ